MSYLYRKCYNLTEKEYRIMSLHTRSEADLIIVDGFVEKNRFGASFVPFLVENYPNVSFTPFDKSIHGWCYSRMLDTILEEDYCPKCCQQKKERVLFNSTYFGCLC